MKSLFTILFSILLTSALTAQNKPETLKWLNKHKKYITMINPSGYSSKDFTVEMTESFIRAESRNDGEKYETKMYWSQIKKTMLGLTSGEKGYVTLNTEDEGFSAPSITLYLSDYSTEMREKLTLMANLSGTDVMMQTLDLRGSSIFGN
ncbi:hypothetical protein HYN56_19910 [Flavobacterium crocinum]|uniref:DUF4252 domain-containing protein n=1 Tax=Flavobacterium crocinum TaxID=2183896 RepID=A0A2S1YRG3_9FLAO|nr:hypothetical protein [Flavobacterium crocinum]AWK06368.1 hypothetical protein HYN56_19910 [Flavobacterium crocinum]